MVVGVRRIITSSDVGVLDPESKTMMGACEGLLAAVKISDDEVDVGLDEESEDEF